MTLNKQYNEYLKNRKTIEEQIKENILQDISKKTPVLPIYYEITNKFENNKDLYFVHQKGTNLFKIGVSNNPEARLKALETANPNDLELFIIIKNGGCLESDFHVFFSPFNMKNEC